MPENAALKNVEDIYPLTAMQRIMLLEAVQQPASLSNLEQFTFLIRGQLNIDAYQRAWDHAIERHAVLRSRFVWRKDDQPLQVVMRDVELPWSNIDWTGRDDAAELDAFLEEDRHTLFDMMRPPLMRMTLARLDDQTHRLIWTFHHILVDAWSVSMLLNDVHDAYEAIAAGREPDLGAPTRFRDAIAAIQEVKPHSAEAYFRELLQGFDTPTPLVFTRSDDDIVGRPQRLETIHVALEGDDFETLKTFARQHHVTLSTMMLAAWTLVVARTGMTDDITVGMTTSGRAQPVDGIERIVGLLMNAVPMRIATDPARSVADFLSAIQHQVGETTQHDQTSLSDIQRWSDVARPAPLFNSLVVFGNYPLDEARSGRATSITIEQPKSYGWAAVPLMLMVTPWDALDIEARFDEAAVDAALVRRLMDFTIHALRDLCRDANRPVAEVSIIDAAERSRLLDTATTITDAPKHDTIHACFAAQAARTPDAPAYVSLGRPTTYAEIDRMSAGIAQHLRAAGVKPGTPVGVCIEPSPQLPAAMFGVLRAGCCYVPLDPTYPIPRLEHIVRDAEPPVILTSDAADAAVPRTGAEIVDVATIEPVASPALDDAPPEGVAYIIYTSGSTGRPKGVRGTHRGALNRFRWMWNFRPFKEGEIASWSTTINFVDHVWEVFGSVLAGTRVEIIPRDTVRDPRALVAMLRKSRVTRIIVVPSLLEAILDTAPHLGKRVPKLRSVVTSGEALPTSLAARFRSAAPDVELINLYGSSEIAADVTAHVVSDEDFNHASIPIGRPVDNVRVVLLDDHCQPTPEGFVGGVYIGGPALADGYHNAPELTAERFVPNRLSELGCTTLFRTGDLGRWNERGELEFLGRADGQVKIRGNRVELGDVEHTMTLHPGVSEAAAICRNTVTGPALHAYVVQDNGSVDVAEVRRFLRGRLPDYMIPNAIIPLTELPRTPNGKLDRKALPEPDHAGASKGDEETTPEIATIARIFGDVLERPQVGSDDCFFDLGGHSLLAVKLIAKLDREFKTTVPLNKLLRASTPRDLAESITGDDPHDTSLVVPLRKNGSRIPFFCIHGMNGNILFVERLLNGLSPEQPLYGILARGVHGEADPNTSIEAMADEYVEAIRATQPQGPYVVGGYSLGGMIAIEVAHRLADAGEDVARIVLIDTYVPRFAGERSRKMSRVKLLLYHLKRGPRKFFKVLWIGPIQRYAWRFCKAFKLPMPRRLRPWPVRLACLRAVMQYQPRPWGGPITLLRGEKQHAELHDVDALGWERYARGELDVRLLPAEHLDFFGKHSIGIVSSAMEEVLADCATIHADEATASPSFAV